MPDKDRGPLLLTLLLADFLTGLSTDLPCAQSLIVKNMTLPLIGLAHWNSLTLAVSTSVTSSTIRHFLISFSPSSLLFQNNISHSVQSNASLWKLDTSNCLSPSLKSMLLPFLWPPHSMIN